MNLTDADIDRIADRVVAKLLGATSGMVEISKEVKLTVYDRKALSRQRVANARRKP